MLNYKNLKISKDQDPTFSGDEDQEIHVFDFKKPALPVSERNDQRSLKKLFIIILILLSSIYVSFHLFQSVSFEEASSQLKRHLKSEYKNNITRFILASFALVNFAVISCLGMHSFICVVIASIMNNFVFSFPLLLVSSISGDLLAYFIANFACKGWLYSKFKDNNYFLLLQEESTNSPYKTALLTRCLFIPVGIKDFLLSLIDNPLKSYVLSGILLHSFYVLEACLIAQEIRDVGHMMSKKQTWSDKSLIQKVSFLAVLAFIVFTIAFIFLIGRWATNKIKSKSQSEQSIMQDIQN
jgi:hypothetical protein